MALQVAVEVRDAQVKKLMDDLAQFDTRLLPKAERKIALVILARTAKSFDTHTAPDGSPWPQTKSRDGVTLRDTGRMMRSFKPQSGQDWAGAFTYDKRAPIHHRGGTIKPTNGKWLTIPWPGAFSAGQLRRGVRYADFQPFTWTNFWTKTGTPVVYLITHKRGAKGSAKMDMKPIFYLKKSVTMPPRPMVGVANSDWPLIGQALFKVIDEATKP
jgi:phage gpG-like protein